MTGGIIKLPSDDMHLEMEEVEGLVRIGNKPIPKKKSLVASIISGYKTNSRWKWCTALLVVAALLVLLFASDSQEVGSLEQERSHSGVDVMHKNTTNDEDVVVIIDKKEPPENDKVVPNDDDKEQQQHDEEKEKPKEFVVDKDKNGETTKDKPASVEEKTPEEPASPEEKEKPAKEEPPAPVDETKDEKTTAPAKEEEKPTKESKEKESNEETAAPVEETKEEKKTAPAEEEEDKATEESKEEESKEESKEEPAAPEQKETKEDEPPKQQPVSNESNNNDDYCAAFPHRDVPLDKFPADAWQANEDKVKAYIENAQHVVDTAIMAIHAEYGKDISDSEFVNLMFHINMDTPWSDAPLDGGVTYGRSWDGLVRRVLHAMITSDTFTFVLGGHSAAAGHGNHFQQSYTMQFHKVMEPVFKKLGIQLTSRNLAQGGLGTIQSAMAAGSIYGSEMDMIVWDSGMTERDLAHIDLFMRQALIGGNRVPALWGGKGAVLKMLYDHADADVGQFGSGMLGIPKTIDETQVETLPFAVRYMACDQERQDLCKNNRFRANCWIDRPDVTPPTKQLDHPGSQVSWHPGFRVHQLTGRVLAMTVLQALRDALQKWKAVLDNGKLLPDASEWHMTEYYNNIRTKVMNLDPSIGYCYNIDGMLPTRVCNTPMKGRTEFTPRANPEETDIRSIIKPDADGWVPRIETELLYEGPNVYNPMLNVPDGEVDVVKIINGTRRRRSLSSQAIRSTGRTNSVQSDVQERRTASDKNNRRLDEIVVGKGWELQEQRPGRCGGEYHDDCGRTADNDCLLSGHHDRRNGILGNEYSGWLVLEIPAVKEGLIILKLETWHFPEENIRTKDWTTVNNEPETTSLRRRRLGATTIHGESDENADQTNRRLKRQPEPLTDDFMFDVAINGKITSWNKTEFEEHRKVVQRVVEDIVVLDDPKFSNGKEETVEVAFRMRNCGRHNNFKLTHVYWA